MTNAWSIKETLRIKFIGSFYLQAFNFRLFLLLTFAFIAFTVIGTVSHESGHYIMARFFGFEASIHYNYTRHNIDQKEWEFFKSTWIKYRPQINANQSFPEKDRFNKIVDQYKRAGIWINLGGPLQTMLTGTIGLILMIFLRKRYFSSELLSFWLWLIIFITLFWLRQTTNFIMALISFIVRGTFRGFGDESGLALHYNLPIWFISSITALIGVVILIVVIFRFVPIKQRLTFITAGLVGGITGFLFWLVFFGKMIMP